MKINISIDDVTPHPRSGVGVLTQCENLRQEFPGIKFTLFVPTAYYRTVPSPPESVCEKPLFISEHPDFCDVLRRLPPENYELAFHGHHHGIPGRSNNDELQCCDYQQAVDIISCMKSEVIKAGLDNVFKPILRPPAWRMSPSAFDAARDCGIRTLALSPKEYARKTYGGKDTSIDWLGHIVYYDSAPPFDPLTVKEKLELVFHACLWDGNSLHDAHTLMLMNFLSSNDHVPCFIEQLL